MNYNGYQREIISKNPARVDADGDVLDDEEESNPDLTDAEEDPYQDIKLEGMQAFHVACKETSLIFFSTELLMPLVNAADLDKHPSLSIPYKSRVIEEMVQSAQAMVFREQRSLFRMRLLLTQFRGDENWVPCGALQQEGDIFTLPVGPGAQSVAPSIATDPTQVNANWDTMSGIKSPLGVDATPKRANGLPSADKDLQDELAADTKKAKGSEESATLDEAHAIEAQVTRNGEKEEVADNGDVPVEAQNPGPDSDLVMADAPTSNGMSKGTDDVHEANGIQTRDMANREGGEGDERNGELGEAEGEADDDNESQQTHRMTTRARAQATDNPTVSPPGSRPLTPQTDSGAPMVHPFFMVPPSCLPQPSLGLQGNLADDTRRLLASFVQKQEEVVRQAEAVLTGLMKAQRLRNTVWSWCRAEGHVGEMSDGEDWYDMEEWGLDEPLKKGEEIEDDDVGPTVAGSKTRGRNRRNDRM